MALGTSPNPLLSSTTEGLETNRKGCLIADEKSGQTMREGVFAGGDAVIGAATVILAMGAGKQAARGIDVDNLAMVINFDLPNEAENYVHRIGRTARAGKTGKAYTFCSEQDVYSLPPIERFIEMQIPSKVADDSLMAEDKSKGIYIQTEFQKDYDDSPAKPHRNERGAKREHMGDGKRKYERTKGRDSRFDARPERHSSKQRAAVNPRGVQSPLRKILRKGRISR